MFILQTLVSSMDCIIELEVVRAIFNWGACPVQQVQELLSKIDLWLSFSKPQDIGSVTIKIFWIAHETDHKCFKNLNLG